IYAPFGYVRPTASRVSTSTQNPARTRAVSRRQFTGGRPMLDHVIPKPARVAGYMLHQIAEGLTEGGRPLFVDRGDHLLVRTDKPVTANPISTRTVDAGDVVAFELRACVAKKHKGRPVYFPLADWRTRHDWLNRKAAQN